MASLIIMLIFSIGSIAMGLIFSRKPFGNKWVGWSLFGIGLLFGLNILLHTLFIYASVRNLPYILAFYIYGNYSIFLFLALCVCWIFVLVVVCKNNPKIMRIVLITAGIILILASGIIRGIDWQLTKRSERQALDTWTIVGFIIGGLMFVAGLLSGSSFVGSRKTRREKLSQTTPIKIEIGQNPEQVKSILGAPEKIISLEDRIVYIYNDLKVVFIDSKVSDVEY